MRSAISESAKTAHSASCRGPQGGARVGYSTSHTSPCSSTDTASAFVLPLLLAGEEWLDKRGIGSDSLAGCRRVGTAFVCCGLVARDWMIAVLRRRAAHDGAILRLCLDDV